MKDRAHKRRRLLVDGSQRQLLAVYFAHFAIMLVVFFAALAFVFNQQVLQSELTVEQKHEMTNMVMSFSNKLWPVLWGLFLALIIHALYVSNKIAGPLYRIRCVLMSVESGNLTVRAKIRGGDYLKQDARAVNDMVTELDKKIGGIRNQWILADEKLASLREAIADGSLPESDERAGELKEHLDRWKKRLDAFLSTVPELKPVRIDLVDDEEESEEEPSLAN